VGSSGYLLFTAQLTDSLGASAAVTPKFWMYDHISLAGGTCYGSYGTGCTVRLPISGGNGGYSVQLVSEAQNSNRNPNGSACWTLTATQPPPGSSAAVSGDYVVVSIPPRVLAGYGAVWTLRLGDSFLCTANTYCTAPEVTVTIGVACG
jgi:hypothetical protein